MRSKKPGRTSLSYDALDVVIHERARLSIMTCLVTHSRGLAFADLKTLCTLTDGNLSQHLQVLKDARLIDITKGMLDNRPHTFCRITSQGRKRYMDYLAALEAMIRHVTAAEQDPVASDGNPDLA